MEVKDKKIYDYISNGKLEIERIMKDYTNYVYTIIRKSYTSLPKEDMDEINLDVFLILWKNQSKLNINNSMTAYIAGITNNLVKQKYRNVKINGDFLDYEDNLISLLDVEILASKNEKKQVILKELSKMKDEDKEIFISYYYENMTAKQISKIHNMSESKVTSKLFRFKKHIQKVLKKGGYDFYD